MRQSDLNRRRLGSPNIPTDSNGNITIAHTHKVSGKARRKECFGGRFHCKQHSDGIDVSGRTYTQYNFGAPLPSEKQTDTPYEEN